MTRHVDQTTLLKDIMTTPVLAVTLSNTVSQVLKLAREKNVTGFPVVDLDHKVIGIVSTLDILMEVSVGKLHSKLGELPLIIKVDKHVIHFSEDTPVKDALLALIKNHIGRIVVTDANNRLKGIVSRKDLINFFVDLYASEDKSNTPDT